MSPPRVEICEDVIYQPLQNEVVLLNMTSQQYFGLNDVGTDMWKLLIEHRDVETVLECLCEEYSADKETLRRDLDTLIQGLLAEGLLKAAEPQRQSSTL
jgi:Coenzyme PQQ synthesis protein D (PqqD)